MWISDAIRKGSFRYQQCRRRYFEFARDGRIIACCPLGSALLAALREHGHRVWTITDLGSAIQKFGYSLDEIGQAILGFFPNPNGWGEVVYWNDTLNLSREEIADRLDERFFEEDERFLEEKARD